MSLAPGQPPLMNPLPPVVVALALAIFAVEIVFQAGARGILGGAGAVGWRIEAMEEFGVWSAILRFIAERGEWVSPQMRRFVTYPFVHFSFTHAVFVIVFLLAMGKLVGEVLGTWAVLATFFVSAIVGGLVYSGLTDDGRPLIGGFPAVYGLIGTYTFILWVSLGHAGRNQLQAFSLIGVLLAIQLVFGLLFEVGNDWVAEVAGFLTGFVIAPLVAKGGLRRLLSRLRQR